MTFQITGQQFLLPSNLSAPSLNPLQADIGRAGSSSAAATTASSSAKSQTILHTLGLIGQTLSLLVETSLSHKPTAGGGNALPQSLASPSGGVANPNQLAATATQRNATADPAQRDRLNSVLSGVAQDPEGSKLLQAAMANGYTIEVGDPSAATSGSKDGADADEVNGVTLTDQKKIIINPNAPDFAKTVVHELVHAATPGDGDSKDEEGKADVIGYRVADRITGQAPPVQGASISAQEQSIYNNKFNNSVYASLAASNGVDQTLGSLGIQAFA